MLGKQELVLPSVNMLSAGTEVKGDITTIGDFRIDGSLKGNVICKKLTIGTTGNIEGQIDCQNAEISGEVNGRIVASELIILKETSKFNGDIDTDKLMVEAGAKLTITCKTNK
jgi:cytoskeletal protein CcmA (bactofilin family)